MAPTGDSRGSAQGFSLAETIVALGVLASVLISVAGLLVLGNQLVKSGRGSSVALAVARDVLEECDGWSFKRTYEEFGCDATQPSCTVDTEHPSMDQWRQALEQGVYMGNAEVLIESVETGAVPLGQSRALRVTVAVSWQEGQRSRSARLTTVRM